MGTKELKPIRANPDEFRELEKGILTVLREEIYFPILKELDAPVPTLTNSMSDIIDAIRSGQISFQRAVFTGRFSASISRELKSLGAVWDRKKSGWTISASSLPTDIKAAISTSESKFRTLLATIDRKLAKLLPAKVADMLKVEKIFDRTLHKIEASFNKTVASVRVPAQFTDESRKAFAEKYSRSLKFYVADFTRKQTAKLRADVQAHSFSGSRYESMISKIQKNYEVSANKAKFLARQETNLMTAKYKEVRYQDIGIKQYKWRCSAGSELHPVRPIHRKLNGKTFSWDNPPIVNEKGERKNPGEDFGCRCVAIPIVKF